MIYLYLWIGMLICFNLRHSISCQIEAFVPSRSGGGGMVYYRLYLVSEVDGRFVGFEEINAPDDVEAMRLATRHSGPQPLELWCGKRKVKAFPAGDSETVPG